MIVVIAGRVFLFFIARALGTTVVSCRGSNGSAFYATGALTGSLFPGHLS